MKATRWFRVNGDRSINKGECCAAHLHAKVSFRSGAEPNVHTQRDAPHETEEMNLNGLERKAGTRRLIVLMKWLLYCRRPLCARCSRRLPFCGPFECFRKFSVSARRQCTPNEDELYVYISSALTGFGFCSLFWSCLALAGKCKCSAGNWRMTSIGSIGCTMNGSSTPSV